MAKSGIPLLTPNLSLLSASLCPGRNSWNDEKSERRRKAMRLISSPYVAFPGASKVVTVDGTFGKPRRKSRDDKV